jgi:hypothetical protein
MSRHPIALTLLASLAAAPAAAQQVTFARDVAPIFYESCAECHRPNSFAPMSLLDYQTARRYAARIKSRVEQRPRGTRPTCRLRPRSRTATRGSSRASFIVPRTSSCARLRTT